MSKFDRQIETAARLIEKNGQLMTLTRNTFPVAYDPVNPASSGQVQLATTSGYGVVLPASQGTTEAFDDRVLTDPSVRRSFRFIILAGRDLTFKPLAEDRLVTAEGECRVLGATPLNPDGDKAIIFNVGATLEGPVPEAGEVIYDGGEI